MTPIPGHENVPLPPGGRDAAQIAIACRTCALAEDYDGLRDVLKDQTAEQLRMVIFTMIGMTIGVEKVLAEHLGLPDGAAFAQLSNQWIGILLADQPQDGDPT